MALMSSAKVISRWRRASATAPVAAARRSVNTISGSRAPSAAAANGLGGIKRKTRSRRPGSSWALSTVVGISTATGQMAITTAMNPIPMTMAGMVIPQKKPNADPPSFPTVLGFPRRATPTKMVVTTSGMTTIRIALMNSVPRGATPSAKRSSIPMSVALARSPSASPRISPRAVARWFMRPPPGESDRCDRPQGTSHPGPSRSVHPA